MHTVFVQLLIVDFQFKNKFHVKVMELYVVMYQISGLRTVRKQKFSVSPEMLASAYSTTRPQNPKLYQHQPHHHCRVNVRSHEVQC
jgi:hypothetical protein